MDAFATSPIFQGSIVTLRSSRKVTFEQHVRAFPDLRRA